MVDTMTSNQTITRDSDAHRRQVRKVQKAIAGSSFATLATVSEAGRPHVAGVVYEATQDAIWVHTMRSSRKARNVAVSPFAAVCIPLRKLPAGPPYTIHFQAAAELVAMDAEPAVRLIEAGQLSGISGHGALEEPDGVLLRLTPRGAVHSYGLGTNPIELIRDPLHSGARSVDLDRVTR